MEGISPKDFRYYHNPLDLLKNLTDVDINPKVLKNQTNFKSIRLKYIYILKKKKIKIRNSNTCITKCCKFV